MLPAGASIYTFFVGRDKELDEISKLIENPACRLLTLLGPGGIGKTRLATEAARRQSGNFPDGICFIPLQPLNSHEYIVPALVDRLNIQFAPDNDLLGQLLNYLRDKSILLILDNLEHLLEGLYLISDILVHAPQVKILVTSRERLNLIEEWVFEVRGLIFPTDKSDTDIERYDAIQLFIQNARRVHHSFTLTRVNKPDISRICGLVGGMPLGIELASAWVHVLPCEVIADEIQRSLDILESPARNISLRHRNMRAVFEPTWSHLTEQERAVFKRLSVFHGSFSLEAAQIVAGASRTTLLSLIDQSLLQVDDAGRYSIHELLRQYGMEQFSASPQEREQTLDLHRAYYMGLLANCEQMIVYLGQQKKALAIMKDELENARIAWQRAVLQGRYVEMACTVEGLWSFY